MTGLESKKMVRDEVMEYHEDDESEEDSEEENSEEEDEDSDDENYGVYSVATKEEYVPVEVKTKKKTKGGKQGVQQGEEESDNKKEEEEEDVWSQRQQEALEVALKQFPKGTAERWDRIASKVPEKTREQCMARFKSLAEAIRKKKEQQQQHQTCEGASKAEEVEA